MNYITPYIHTEMPEPSYFLSKFLYSQNFAKLLTVKPPGDVEGAGRTLLDGRRRELVFLPSALTLGLVHLPLVAIGNVWLHPLPDGEVHLLQYGVEQLDSAH